STGLTCRGSQVQVLHRPPVNIGTCEGRRPAALSSSPTPVREVSDSSPGAVYRLGERGLVGTWTVDQGRPSPPSRGAGRARIAAGRRPPHGARTHRAAPTASGRCHAPALWVPVPHTHPPTFPAPSLLVDLVATTQVTPGP